MKSSLKTTALAIAIGAMPVAAVAQVQGGAADTANSIHSDARTLHQQTRDMAAQARIAAHAMVLADRGAVPASVTDVADDAEAIAPGDARILGEQPAPAAGTSTDTTANGSAGAPLTTGKPES